MNRQNINEELDNEIISLLSSKTPGQLIEIVQTSLSKLDLLSVPEQHIVSIKATELGVMIKTEPNGQSITLSSLSIDDKFRILESIK